MALDSNPQTPSPSDDTHANGHPKNGKARLGGVLLLILTLLTGVGRFARGQMRRQRTQDQRKQVEYRFHKALIHAAGEGDVEAMQRLFDKGGRLHERDHAQVSLMHRAAASGRVAALDWLKAHGVAVDVLDYLDNSPMHWAASGRGDTAVMTWLADEGVAFDAPNKHGETPLWTAAAAGHLDALAWLETRGAIVDAVNNTRATTMQMAARHGHPAAMRWLAERGVPVDTIGANEQTPMFEAAEVGHVDVMAWLKERGVDLDRKNSFGYTALFHAARGGHLDALQWLREHGADFSVVALNNQTPLHEAAERGHWQAVRWLHAEGVAGEPSPEQRSGMLRKAVATGGIEALQWLREQGADFTILNDDGEPLVFGAAGTLRLDAAAIPNVMAGYGTDVHARDETGTTPTQRVEASIAGDPVETLKILHALGADLTATGLRGETVMHRAAERGEPATVRWLIEQGLAVEARNETGQTPMHIAAGAGWVKRPEVMALLKKHGADVNARDRAGKTPLHYAKEAWQSDAKLWLSAYGGQ